MRQPAGQRSAGSALAITVFGVSPPPPWRATPPKRPPVPLSERTMSGKDPTLKPLRAMLGLTA